MLIHSKHTFLFTLPSHIITIILMISMNFVCRKLGLGVPVMEQNPVVGPHMKPFWLPKGLLCLIISSESQWKHISWNLALCDARHHVIIDTESQNSPGWIGPQKIMWSNLSWERDPTWGVSFYLFFYYLSFPSLILDVLHHMLMQSWLLLAIIQKMDNSRMENYRNRMQNSKMPKRTEIWFWWLI